MAVLVFTNPYVSINGVDLSDHVRSMTLNDAYQILENTAAGATGVSRIAGLQDANATITFNQDFASGKVEATMGPLAGAAAFAIIFKPNGSATATTNPKWTGNAVLESNPVIGGAVGDNYEVTYNLLAVGKWTRATAD